MENRRQPVQIQFRPTQLPRRPSHLPCKSNLRSINILFEPGCAPLILSFKRCLFNNHSRLHVLLLPKTLISVQLRASSVHLCVTIRVHPRCLHQRHLRSINPRSSKAIIRSFKLTVPDQQIFIKIRLNISCNYRLNIRSGFLNIHLAL